jgi:hypothetical protein
VRVARFGLHLLLRLLRVLRTRTIACCIALVARRMLAGFSGTWHAACGPAACCAVRRASDAATMPQARRHLLQRGVLLADLRQLDLVLQR